MTSKGKIYSFYIYKNKSQSKILVYSAIAMICLAVFLMIFLFVDKLKANFNTYEKGFLLSLDHSTNYQVAETLQKEAEEVVGISYLYKAGNIYHILGFVYETELEAKTMLESLEEFFPNAQILVDNRGKIKTKVYNKIAKDTYLKKILEIECGLKNDILSLCKNIKEDNARINTYRDLTKLELKLDESFEYLSTIETNDTVEALKVTCSVMISLIRACKEELAIQGDELNNIKLLYIKVYFEEGELRRNLNKL